jgi:hypothetical protein
MLAIGDNFLPLGLTMCQLVSIGKPAQRKIATSF